MEEQQETVLARISKRLTRIDDPNLLNHLLSLDEEYALATRYFPRSGGSVSALPTKADECLDEIEFYIANDMIRHLCAVAADFYDRLGHVGWEPVGFFIGGGRYREIKIRFRHYCPKTRTEISYFGKLSRNKEHGERYQLIIDDNPDGLHSCRNIFDVLNTLAVPRAYLDGLFDMIEYADEPLEQKYEHTRNEFARLSAALSKINYELRDRSSKLQALKRPQKWRKKFASLKLPETTTQMPAPPTETVSLIEAQTLYSGFVGVYFLWDASGDCAYVGKSKNIGSRLSGHHKAEAEDHRVSILTFDALDVHYAELYYIWFLRPYLNKEGIETARELEKTNKNTEITALEV